MTGEDVWSRALQTPEKPLLELVGAPFHRETYLPRLSALVDRYERLLRLADHPSDRALTVRLLLEHPGALREHGLLDRRTLLGRLEEAHVAFERHRSGAPLPPESLSDRRIAATADLEWIVRELRALRRLGLSRYVDRGAPLPLQDASLREVAGISPARVLRAVGAVVGARHRIPDFLGYLLPEHPSHGPRHRVAPAADIEEGGCARVVVAGNPIAVFRHGGTLHAVDDTCPHRGAFFSKGKVDDGDAVCPLHGWRFDLRTGEMAGNPNFSIRTYEVLEEEGVVYVVAGDR